MNKETLAGKWHELKGNVKEKWGKLTDSDIAQINGKREILLGKLESRYGYAKEKAEKELQDFEKSCGCSSATKEGRGDMAKEGRGEMAKEGRSFQGKGQERNFGQKTEQRGMNDRGTSQWDKNEGNQNQGRTDRGNRDNQGKRK